MVYLFLTFCQFSEKYNLQVRVISEFSKSIYKFDPDVRNCKLSTLYCMLKHNHIYLLNNDIKHLQQVIQDDDDDEHNENAKPPKASNNFIIKDDDEIKTYDCHMIEDVDDILKIMNQYTGTAAQTTIYLVHKHDDLNDLLFKCWEDGYAPGINHRLGNIVTLFWKFDNITFIIKSQKLVTSSIERHVSASTADVFNNMSLQFQTFHKKLFKLSIRSSYSDEDIKILDEHRTVANVGFFKERVEGLIEIDVSKAYTHAFTNISEVTVFNEFDNFEPYTNDDINDLSLYLIKTNTNTLFCNKQYNLCYGLFLKKSSTNQILKYNLLNIHQQLKK